MSCGLFLYTDEFQQYDMGSQHPLKPIRLKRTYDLLAAYGALDDVGVREPTPCTADDLLPSHSAEYIESVDRLSAGEHVPFPFRYGFGYGDNPVFPGMWEASLLYTGASIEAARAVGSGGLRVAMNISGGLHHAHYDRASGFCVFNDCVAAIHELRKTYAKVAYIDIDVHHGDGVQEAFYSDPSVLTVSIHESGTTLFPGSGFVRELGTGSGIGYSVNMPLWPYTDDDVWYGVWRESGLPIIEAFGPDAICLECGTDPHYLDPLARICLTAQGWMRAVRDVAALGKPVVALGGGGYNQTTVPRMWALVFSALFNKALPNRTPDSFLWHEQIPTLEDATPPSVAPHDLEQARAYGNQTVREVRERIFKYHGL